MKLREKKVNVFGKSVPVIAVIAMVLLAGIAGAALVDYLSNTVHAEITVKSPMRVGVSLGGWEETTCVHPVSEETVDCYPEGDHDLDDWTTEESPLPIDTIGGKTTTLYYMSENMADVEITGFEKAIVTNTAGVTPDDFESVIVRVDSIYGDLGYGTPQELIGTGGCQQIDETTVHFGSLTNSIWGVGETDVGEIVVTFKPNANGIYTFTYQIVIPEA